MEHVAFKDLEYCPDTGSFFWKKTRNQMAVEGSEAGCVDNKGYRVITYDGKRYKAHRLAWFFVHNQWPKNQIDHIDENKSNNRISNLRDVSQSVNQHNISIARKDNTSGHRAIHWHKQHQKWNVRVQLEGKRHEVGLFEDLEDAIQARNNFLGGRA